MSFLTLACVGLAAAISAIVSWTKRQFSVRAFLTFFGVVLVINVLGFVNNWPVLRAGFSTAQPLMNQLLILAAGGLMSSLVIPGFLALIAGLVFGWIAVERKEPSLPGSLTALALAAIPAGIAVVLSWVGGGAGDGPLWPDFSSLDRLIPAVGPALDALSRLIMTGLLVLYVIALVDRFSRGWSRMQPLAGLGLFLFGLVGAGAAPSSVERWLVSGVMSGALLVVMYVLVLRRDMTLLPLVIAGWMALQRCQQLVLNAYPGAIVGQGLAVIVLLAFGFWWWRTLNSKPKDLAESAGLPAPNSVGDGSQ
jgi:hypothetical protein